MVVTGVRLPHAIRRRDDPRCDQGIACADALPRDWSEVPQADPSAIIYRRTDVIAWLEANERTQTGEAA